MLLIILVIIIVFVVALCNSSSDAPATKTTSTNNSVKSNPFKTISTISTTYVDTNPDVYVERANIAFREHRNKDAINELELSLKYSNAKWKYIKNYLSRTFFYNMKYECGKCALLYFETLAEQAINIINNCDPKDIDYNFLHSELFTYIKLYCTNLNAPNLMNKFIRIAYIHTYNKEYVVNCVKNYSVAILNQIGPNKSMYKILGNFYLNENRLFESWKYYHLLKKEDKTFKYSKEIIKKIPKYNISGIRNFISWILRIPKFVWLLVYTLAVLFMSFIYCGGWTFFL